MSKALRLLSIINRYIVEKWLGEKSKLFPEDDKSIPSILDQSSLTAPFYAYFHGSSISDGIYFISASSAISLPHNSIILVTDWNLTYNENLHLVILQAELQTEIIEKGTFSSISIEKNPLISGQLKKFRFMKLKARAQEEVRQERAGLSPEDGETEKDFKWQVKQEDEELKKASLKVEATKEENEDDIFDMIELDGETGRPSSLQPNELDIGIEQFPEYALEYLKHKYNVI